MISDRTQVLTTMLKPGFAPIEQYGGVMMQGPWTDLYALAGVVHYAITGRPPMPSVVRVVSDSQTSLAATHAGRYGDGLLRAIDAALAALAPRGMLGLVGVPPRAEDALSINLAGMIAFGQRVIGIMEGDSDPQTFIPELIAHHAAGRFPSDRLVQTFPLAEINGAIAAQGRGDCVKVVLIP